MDKSIDTKSADEVSDATETPSIFGEFEIKINGDLESQYQDLIDEIVFGTYAKIIGKAGFSIYPSMRYRDVIIKARNQEGRTEQPQELIGILEEVRKNVGITITFPDVPEEGDGTNKGCHWVSSLFFEKAAYDLMDSDGNKKGFVYQDVCSGEGKWAYYSIKRDYTARGFKTSAEAKKGLEDYHGLVNVPNAG